MRYTKTALELWDRVKVGHPQECWPFLGTPTGAGYALFGFGKVKHYGHRLAYELIKGAIPNGLVIDHVCQNKICCNPFHLEAVTLGENFVRSPHGPAARNARKVSCPQGHPYAGSNLRLGKDGSRICRACHRGNERNRRNQGK